MAHPHELQALNNAFSGLGVDEKAIISSLGKSSPDQRKSFRKGHPVSFFQDARDFERWNEHQVKQLKREVLRFKNAIVLWAMHPWERDARLVKEALKKAPEWYGSIIEVACTRSSEELLGARKAYHSLFDHSIEEDVAHHVHGRERKLLVALVSAYRYEGPKVKEDTTKSEAKTLLNALKNPDKKMLIEDEDIVRILTTRSKAHLKLVYKYYKDIGGKTLDEDLDADLRLKETVQCLCNPQRYFCKVLDAAMKPTAHKNTQKGLTRVITTRADIDMKEIKEEYQKTYGVSLTKKIEDTTKGSYRDLLLTIMSRAN